MHTLDYKKQLPGITGLLRFTCLISGVFSILLPGAGHAYDFYVEDRVKEIRRAIDRPLPSIEEVLGERIENAPAPVLVIGFLDNGDSIDRKDWGKAIGWYLMESTAGTTDRVAVIPSFQYLSDGITLDTDKKDTRGAYVERVASRTGAKYVISGRVGVTEKQIVLELKAKDYETGRQISVIEKEGTTESIGQLIASVANKTFQALLHYDNPASANSDFTMATPVRGEIEALATAFAEGEHLAPREKADHYEALWKKSPIYSTTGTLYLNALDTLYDDERLDIALAETRAARHPTPTFLLYSHVLRSRIAPGGIDNTSVEFLKSRLISNPDNPYAWLALTSAYDNEEATCYTDKNGALHAKSPAIDHHRGFASSVSLGLEMLKRWPNHYRGWWSLGYSLKAYAGAVRGPSYWRQVPDQAKVRYKNILAVADSVFVEAMKRHPAQGKMYINLIGLDVAFGRNWMSTFRRAATLAPHNYYTYAVAFNYAQSKWGGTEDYAREIYKLAKANNPQENWPQQLRDVWAPGIKPIVDLEDTATRIILAAIVLGLILAGYRFLIKAKNE